MKTLTFAEFSAALLKHLQAMYDRAPEADKHFSTIHGLVAGINPDTNRFALTLYSQYGELSLEFIPAAEAAATVAAAAASRETNKELN